MISMFQLLSFLLYSFIVWLIYLVYKYFKARNLKFKYKIKYIIGILIYLPFTTLIALFFYNHRSTSDWLKNYSLHSVLINSFFILPLPPLFNIALYLWTKWQKRKNLEVTDLSKRKFLSKTALASLT